MLFEATAKRNCRLLDQGRENAAGCLQQQQRRCASVVGASGARSRTTVTSPQHCLSLEMGSTRRDWAMWLRRADDGTGRDDVTIVRGLVFRQGSTVMFVEAAQLREIPFIECASVSNWMEAEVRHQRAKRCCIWSQKSLTPRRFDTWTIVAWLKLVVWQLVRVSASMW